MANPKKPNENNLSSIFFRRLYVIGYKARFLSFITTFIRKSGNWSQGIFEISLNENFLPCSEFLPLFILNYLQDTMYSILNTLHSYNRYLLLAALVFVLYRSISGWLGKKPYEKADNASGAALLGFTHLQLLLGLILYGISPRTQAAFDDMGTAMKNPTLRYFAVEHIADMLIAVVLIQLGRTLSKKAVDDNSKHRKVAIYTGIATLIIVATLAQKGLLFGTATAMAG